MPFDNQHVFGACWAWELTSLAYLWSCYKLCIWPKRTNHLPQQLIGPMGIDKLLIKVLWTNSSCSWASLFGIGVRMIKLEVHINFTSLYIIDETFFKRIMICKLVASISTNCYNYIFKNPKGENSNIFSFCPINNKRFLFLVDWSMYLHNHDNNTNNIMRNFTSYKNYNWWAMHKYELNKEKKNFHNLGNKWTNFN